MLQYRIWIWVDRMRENSTMLILTLVFVPDRTCSSRSTWTWTHSLLVFVHRRRADGRNGLIRQRSPRWKTRKQVARRRQQRRRRRPLALRVLKLIGWTQHMQMFSWVAKIYPFSSKLKGDVAIPINDAS